MLYVFRNLNFFGLRFFLKCHFKKTLKVAFLGLKKNVKNVFSNYGCRCGTESKFFITSRQCESIRIDFPITSVCSANASTAQAARAVFNASAPCNVALGRTVMFLSLSAVRASAPKHH